MSGRAHGVAKTAAGAVEAIRVLLVAKRSRRGVRIKSLNQVRHVGFTAPDDLRERFRGVSRGTLARQAAALCLTAAAAPSPRPPSSPCKPWGGGSWPDISWFDSGR